MAKLLIASERVDSESNEITAVKNPATGELVDSVPKGTVNDIRRAIDAAKGALKNGPRWLRLSGVRFYFKPAMRSCNKKRSLRLC